VGASITADEVRAASAKLRADPNLGGAHRIRSLRWTRPSAPDQPQNPPPWIEGLFEYLGQTGSVLLWVVGAIAAAVAVAVAVIWAYRTFKSRIPAPKFSVEPSVARGGEMDIRPESLPADIGAAALGLAEAGKTRDRWIRGVAAVGLIALIVWVTRHTYWDEITVTVPPKGEAARNPYYAVVHLAASLGIHTTMIGSLRELPPDAIVLVNNLSDDLRHESIESLQAWVQAGGRLIIRDATLDESEPLQIWSGIRSAQPDSSAAQPVATPGEDDCKPMAVGIDGIANGRTLVLCDALAPGLTSTRVASWSLSDSGAIQVLRVSIGRGELTVVGPAFMLTNWGLPKKDHAQIFAAAAGLRRGDRLEILSRIRAEPLPVLLWRLAAPAILFLLAAVGLTIIRHLPRFGPPIAVAAPMRRFLAEQIRANARFAWRTQKLASLRAAIRRALDEAAQRQIVGYSLMTPRQRAEALAASTGIDATTISAALVSDAGAGVNEHRAAITLLEACRRILIRSHSHQRHNA
jgi:hypothetical protein